MRSDAVAIRVAIRWRMRCIRAAAARVGKVVVRGMMLLRVRVVRGVRVPPRGNGGAPSVPPEALGRGVEVRRARIAVWSHGDHGRRGGRVSPGGDEGARRRRSH